jgi:hypothetical protein
MESTKIKRRRVVVPAMVTTIWSANRIPIGKARSRKRK